MIPGSNRVTEMELIMTSNFKKSPQIFGDNLQVCAGRLSLKISPSPVLDVFGLSLVERSSIFSASNINGAEWIHAKK
ncbi:hypothetical protein D4L85_19320 [Chryseolinea soli]|uniref:Uncharacterized protein n=1 Tax=Chryseolinea soli TaxID=2321403 RepID=A0A385SNN9_9BACT|nr:hypothetical protein D4L85_19320 [Chryseolinea soli]